MALIDVLRRARIKDGVLSLDNKDLGNTTIDELVQAFSAISADVTSVNLSKNKLGYFTGADLAKAFAAIPATVTSLNLSKNLLSSKFAAELVEAFAALSANVTALNLSENNFGYQIPIKLAEVLAAIPAGVSFLNLAGNKLGIRTVDDLILIFKAIHVGVTTLDLRGNNLSSKTGTELVKIFSAIPPGIQVIVTEAEKELIIDKLTQAQAAVFLDINKLEEKTKPEHLFKKLKDVLKCFHHFQYPRDNEQYKNLETAVKIFEALAALDKTKKKLLSSQQLQQHSFSMVQDKKYGALIEYRSGILKNEITTAVKKLCFCRARRSIL